MLTALLHGDAVLLITLYFHLLTTWSLISLFTHLLLRLVSSYHNHGKLYDSVYSIYQVDGSPSRYDDDVRSHRSAPCETSVADHDRTHI